MIYSTAMNIIIPPPLAAGAIMFSGCPSVRPSVRPKPEIPSFHLYMGPLVHPTNHYRFTTCPSVRQERFPRVFFRRTNGMPEILNAHVSWPPSEWLDYGHALLLFLLLAPFLLIEKVKFCCFPPFPGERMEGIGWNFEWWCILTTFRTD